MMIGIVFCWPGLSSTVLCPGCAALRLVCTWYVDAKSPVFVIVMLSVSVWQLQIEGLERLA